MKQIHFKGGAYNALQKLFVEVVIELCDFRSLDSYRARVAGPIYIIKELYHLIDEKKKGNLKSFETLLACKEEARSILQCDEVLDYGRISKNTLLEMLNNLKDDKGQGFDHLFPRIEFDLYYLLAINDHYVENLVEALEKVLLPQPNKEDEEPHSELIIKNTGFLITELINRGFAKAFIARFSRSIFIGESIVSFDEAWRIFKGRVTEGIKDKFSIIFKVTIPENKSTDISVEDLKSALSVDDFPFIKSFTEINEGNTWLNPSKSNRFFLQNVEAYDHYEALKEAKTRLGSALDFMHIGHSDVKFSVRQYALVINQQAPEKAALQSLAFQIDDSFKSSEESYTNLYSKFLAIKHDGIASKEVVAKIESAVRYLRAGNEAVELEQKFLSYWIGLENIFSTHNINSNTFLRIKKYLTICHLVSYSKRNLHEFHKALKRMDVAKLIPGYDDNLDYLLESNTYEEIIALRERSPLLAMRAKNLKDTYFNGAVERKQAIEKHKVNLERHLVRLYRLRNELVHNAAAYQNIENITSNLRYYLFFILNKTIEYFHGCKPKMVGNKAIEMDDFFFYQEMLWDNIDKESYDLRKLMHVPHPVKFII